MNSYEDSFSEYSEYQQSLLIDIYENYPELDDVLSHEVDEFINLSGDLKTLLIDIENKFNQKELEYIANILELKNSNICDLGQTIIKTPNLYDLQKAEIVKKLFDNLDLNQLQELENKYNTHK